MVILICAGLGVFLAGYIWLTKLRKARLVCVIGEDCDTVVSSKYSRVFGIPNELLGLGYYGTMFLVQAISLAYPAYASLHTGVALQIIAGCAALFSLYLFAIQIFVLKELCEWCLASSILSIIIFVAILL